MNIQHFLEDYVGVNCRSYSGRGMYGETCLGIETDIGELVSNIMLALSEYEENGEMLKKFSRAFMNYRQDSMGLGVIIYFPHIKYEERED